MNTPAVAPSAMALAAQNAAAVPVAGHGPKPWYANR